MSNRIERTAARIGISLPTSAISRLREFADLLVTRAVPLGLVAESDAARMLERHVLDSLRAAAAFRERDVDAYDLGPGAGLPGVVLAVALPDRRFHLVESKRRAVAFLELALDRLGLDNADVLIARAEELIEQADVVTARAFAPLPRAWKVACPLLRPGGRLIHFSGTWRGDPAARARALVDPEPPGEVETQRRVETFGPLVIMSRRG